MVQKLAYASPEFSFPSCENQLQGDRKLSTAKVKVIVITLNSMQ